MARGPDESRIQTPASLARGPHVFQLGPRGACSTLWLYFGSARGPCPWNSPLRLSRKKKLIWWKKKGMKKVRERIVSFEAQTRTNQAKITVLWRIFFFVEIGHKTLIFWVFRSKFSVFMHKKVKNFGFWSQIMSTFWFLRTKLVKSSTFGCSSKKIQLF